MVISLVCCRGGTNGTMFVFIINFRRGTDINIILAKTNEEVSRRVTTVRINKEKCLVAQMPVYKSTLRKSLVFRPV